MKRGNLKTALKKKIILKSGSEWCDTETFHSERYKANGEIPMYI